MSPEVPNQVFTFGKQTLYLRSHLSISAISHQQGKSANQSMHACLPAILPSLLLSEASSCSHLKEFVPADANDEKFLMSGLTFCIVLCLTSKIPAEESLGNFSQTLISGSTHHSLAPSGSLAWHLVGLQSGT